MMPACSVVRLVRSCCRLPQALAVLGGLLTVLSGVSIARAGEAHGVRAPEGFEVSLYADDELAHDIFSMTVDSLGRVVVSGAGYVRILIDSDQDGRADTFRQFSDGPATGAQGLYFHGHDLLCTGDAGLLRYRDQNADDRADGPPDVFLKMKAGGEHDAHAIRKGPDGWWYVLCGNTTGISKKYITLPNSPVADPANGTLIRLRPDLSAGEVVTNGYRNAYDFDFAALGDAFVFDSDGEREITLPWYEPTRVFHAAPGSSAGWFSHDWKRPARFFDLPAVVAEFGRGSPTGVVCYRHTQFPAAYHGALFVLDWTYGRVFAMPLARNGSTVASQPHQFLSAVGEHGFAPTDVDVGPDGSLYVSVGGRGTRGGVYRIRAAGSKDPSRPGDELAACLTAPQPESSWSRRIWEPIAEKLGAKPFMAAATDEKQADPARVRAIEILTEHFGGLDDATASKLAASSSAEVRGRAAWSLGRTRVNAAVLPKLAADPNPLVQRLALEALLGGGSEVIDAAGDALLAGLKSPDRFVRMAAARVLACAGDATFARVASAGVKAGGHAAIFTAAAFCERNPGYQSQSAVVALHALQADGAPELKREAVRLLQLALGDVAPPVGKVPGAFEGYTSRVDLIAIRKELETTTGLVSLLFPARDAELNYELGRVVAMLAPDDDELLAKVIGQISDDSPPVDDLHWLLVAARIPAPRSPETRDRIARALVQLDEKITQRALPLDTSWDDRTGEMYQALVERDPELPAALLSQPGFGRSAHVAFLGALPPERFPEAIDAFLKQIDGNPDYVWTSDIVFLLAHSPEPKIRELVRSKFDDLALRNSVLMAITEEPLPEDRAKFVAGLQNSPLDVMAECVKALLLLEPSEDAEEQVALVRLLRRLGNKDKEREVRDQVVEVLQRNSGKRFSYALGQEGADQQAGIEEWTAAIRQQFPEEFARQSGESAADLQQLRTLLGQVDWSSGDPVHGRKLFETRACIQCHGSRSALGPDLNGVAQRFSKEDLFTAIALPSRDVSPRYQTTMIATRDGDVFTGLIVYESVDGVVLRNSTNQTFRIETKNIEARRALSESIMPNGLLKDLRAQDLADLYAYLRSLSGTAVVGARAQDARESM